MDEARPQVVRNDVFTPILKFSIEPKELKYWDETLILFSIIKESSRYINE